MSPPTLALIIKAPRPREVKTRLAVTVGPAHAVRIYRQMVEKQIQAIPAGWNIRIHCAPAEDIENMKDWLAPLTRPHMTFHAQPEGDLGERIDAAFSDAFIEGSNSVMAIGGDCPALDESFLRRAAQALESHDAVLGPAQDGGYYLLGLSAPSPYLFENMPWSTPVVLCETRRRLAEAKLSTFELPTLNDVDDAESWKDAVAQGWLNE